MSKVQNSLHFGFFLLHFECHHASMHISAKSINRKGKKIFQICKCSLRFNNEVSLAL